MQCRRNEGGFANEEAGDEEAGVGEDALNIEDDDEDEDEEMLPAQR